MKNILGELKRRNVYKVAVAYLVTAWLIIQVVNTIGPNLNWPDSIAPLITRILLVGLPIAIVFAWLYELTPAGFKRTGTVQTDTADNRRAGRRLNHIIIGSLSLVLILMLVERLFLAGSKLYDDKQQASIAVLPFANLSSEEENEYFADGLTEEILDELAQISGMQVLARTSSFKFKDTNEDVRKIGEQLAVNYVLEGSVRYDEKSNRIRITTQLINTANGYHLWSNTYDEDFDQIFDIQEDVSRKVTQELKVRLLPAEDAALADRKTIDTDAYILYVKARTFSVKRNDDDLKKAIALLNEAIEMDPAFAEAYAELSFLYGQRHFYGNLPLAERNEKTEYYLNKALEVNPNKAEVLRAKAENNIRMRKDSSLAIKDVRKAIELKPSYSDAYHLLYRTLRWARQPELATKSLEKAVELDPFNGFYLSMLAQRYFYTPGKREQGLAMIDKAIEESDDNSGYYQLKARMLMASPNGKSVEAFKLVHTNLKRNKWHGGALNHLILFSLNLDLLPLADKYVERLRSLKPNNPNTFWMIYSANKFAGRHEQNLDLAHIWLDQEKMDYYNLFKAFFYTYMHLGDYDKVLNTLRQNDPDIYKVLVDDPELPDLDTVDGSSDLIAGYIDLFRAKGNNDKADILAKMYCQNNSELIEAYSSNDWLVDEWTIECLYHSNDVKGLASKLDSVYFISKNRILGIFSNIQSGNYLNMEDTREFKEVRKRITEDVHRLRAEVIAYLKEEGDWDSAWDKELGLE